MLSPRTVLFAFVLGLLPAVSRTSALRPTAPAAHTIAVADFSGPDKELGRFVAETLLTDLAVSDKLQLVERAELRQALTELKLQSTGLVEPQQVKRLGKLVGADHLVVGSFLIRDEQIILNARLLDVRSGRLVPGGAAHVAGSRYDLLAATHRLARLFHQRVTGSALATTEEDTPEAARDDNTRTASAAPTTEPTEDDLAFLRQSGLIPANAPANGVVTERDLAGLITRITRRTTPQTDTPLTSVRPIASVSRIRALTALVKVFVSPTNIASFRAAPPDTMPPDTAQIPAWGRPYAAAAVEQNWWPADRPLRARETATWAFLAALLSQMPLDQDAPASAPARRVPETFPRSDPDAYTGLVVDARDFRIQRTMSLRILDTDGNVIYPESQRIPDFDFLQDHGMAAYYQDARDARRSGHRPLIVRAIDVAGPGRDELVVSNEEAERIRQENRRGRFLRRWAVCVLVQPH